VSIVVTN